MKTFFILPFVLLSIINSFYPEGDSPKNLRPSFLLPSVNLGPDTIACDQVILDAGNPGSSYLWSTGATSQTLTVTASDTIWVAVTDISGTARDTIVVEIVTTPSGIMAGDTSICGPGQVTFHATGSADRFVWYDTASAGSILGLGTSYQASVTDTSIYYVEARNYSSFIRTAKDTTGGSANSGYYLNNIDRGVIFNALYDFVLEEVMVNVGTVVSSTVELRDASNNLLDSRPAIFTQTGWQVLPLVFTVPQGNGYKLIFKAAPGGRLWSDIPLTLPRTYEGIRITSGIPIVNHYNFFYRWKIAKTYCAPPREPATVFVIPTPVINLGLDTIVCGGNLQLDATDSNPQTTYLWSTGATTPTITLSNTDTVSVISSLGICSSFDTLVAYLLSDPALPIASDTGICGPGATTLIASSASDQILWYDTISGGRPIGLGDSLRVIVTDTASFFAESRNYTPTILTGRLAFGGTTLGGYYTTVIDRGMVFNAEYDFTLLSVTVDVGTGVTSVIELRDVSNNLLASKAVNLTQLGQQVIRLDFDVPAGNGHKLVMKAGNANGRLFSDLPITMPLNYEGITITAGIPISNHYNFFYKWNIAKGFCKSTRQVATVNVIPSPVVDLGNDTVLCGGQLLLDATNPGASYIWSTGATTPTLLVSQTDTVSVEASIGNCRARDTIEAYILVNPQAPSVQPVANCGPGLVDLFSSVAANQVLWYDSAAGGKVIALGDSVSLFVDSTTSYYSEARNYSPTVLTGRTTFGGSTQGAYLTTNIDRGMVFNAKYDFTLTSVTVDVGAAVTSVIELRNSGGVLLDQRPVSLTQLGQVEVRLDFDIPAGNGYHLIMKAGNTNGRLFGDLPLTMPLNYEGITVTAGTPISNHYNFFYRWKISKGHCASSRTPLTVTILPSPVVDLGPDTLTCGSTLLLDATNPGATYLWSTGATTPTLNVINSDTLWVEVAIGSCSTHDSIKVYVLSQPTIPVIADTTVCSPGMLSLHADSVGGQLLWFDSPIGGKVLALGQEATLDIRDTTHLYLEQRLYPPTINAGIPNFGFSPQGNFLSTGIDRGITFNALFPFTLIEVSIPVNLPVSSRIDLLDASNNVLDSRKIDYLIRGLNRVPLNFEVPQGNGYKLIFRGAPDGLFYIDLPVTMPIDSEGVSITAGIPVASHYNYFYDWKIARGYCASSRKEMVVTVKLPIDMEDSIYTCQDTIISAGIPGASYLWNTGASTASIQVSATGKYSVVVSDGAGCSVNDTTAVGFPKAVDLGQDGVLCGDILYSGYDTSAQIQWSTGDTTPSIFVTNTGSYSVTVTEPNGCTLFDSIQVSGFDSFPVVDLGPDQATCDSFILDAGNPGLSYLWSTGATTQKIKVVSSGFYYVIVSNANGCEGGDTVAISITTKPIAMFVTVVNGFELRTNNQSTFGTFAWNFGDGNGSNQVAPIHTYIDTGTYTVSLIVTNNCGSDTFFRTVRIGPAVGIEDDLLERLVEVFPNPVSELLNIRVSAWEFGEFGLSLRTLDGRILYSRTWRSPAGGISDAIPVGELPAGIYLLTINGDVHRLFRKVIVR